MDAITQISLEIEARHVSIKKLTEEIKTLSAALGVLTPIKTLSEVLETEEDWGETPDPSTPELPTKYGEVKASVLKFLQNFEGETFTVNEATAFVSNCLPAFNVETGKANISAYLKEFSENGLIDLIEQGRGRTPASYKFKK